jgi:hypothetical protein
MCVVHGAVCAGRDCFQIVPIPNGTWDIVFKETGDFISRVCSFEAAKAVVTILTSVPHPNNIILDAAELVSNVNSIREAIDARTIHELAELAEPEPVRRAHMIRQLKMGD